MARSSVWEDAEIVTLAQNKHMRAKDLERLLPGRSKNAIYAKLNDLGIKTNKYRVTGTPNIPWSKEEDTLLHAHFLDDWDVLLKLFPNRTKSAIDQRAQKYGLLRPRGPGRAYTFNENYFSLPNTNNCYWGGWLASDGAVFDSFYGKYPTVKLQIQTRDLCVLERLSTDIAFNGPFYYSKANRYVSISFFNSPQMVNDLDKSFNIIPRKSLVLLPPNITDENQIKAFIVGLIDGDGSIMLEKQYNSLRLSIVGTYELLSWVSDFMRPITGSKCKLGKEGNIYKYVLGGRDMALKGLKYLKSTPVWKLPRKWDKVPD